MTLVPILSLITVNCFWIGKFYFPVNTREYHFGVHEETYRVYICITAEDDAQAVSKLKYCDLG